MEKDLPLEDQIAETELESVKGSSNISKVGYHPAHRVLVIHFSYGGKYVYKDVSPETVEAMQQADSVGSFVAREIKPNHEVEKIS